jgi:hypothetical protein
MSDGYDFFFVNIHGSPTLQWLGGSTYLTNTEIKNAKPQSLFNVLASCSNGNFLQSDYFAGWHLFGGNSLVVTANTVDSMLVGSKDIGFLRDYIPLNLGVTFGEMSQNDGSFLVTHLFGDPTLRLRPKPTGDLPHLTLSATSLDFGDTPRGSKPVQSVVFTNEGTAPLSIFFKSAPFSIDGECAALIIGYWDVFYYVNPNTSAMFGSIDLAAGSSMTIPFTFYPRADGPLGTYGMTIFFQSNDPESPFPKVHLTGSAIE